jgi:hypothetical protein
MLSPKALLSVPAFHLNPLPYLGSLEHGLCSMKGGWGGWGTTSEVQETTGPIELSIVMP